MGECTVPLPAQPGPATKCQVPNTEYQLGSAASRASTPKREQRAFWGPGLKRAAGIFVTGAALAIPAVAAFRRRTRGERHRPVQRKRYA